MNKRDIHKLSIEAIFNFMYLIKLLVYFKKTFQRSSMKKIDKLFNITTSAIC